MGGSPRLRLMEGPVYGHKLSLIACAICQALFMLPMRMTSWRMAPFSFKAMILLTYKSTKK